jgi:hypothetical protein
LATINKKYYTYDNELDCLRSLLRRVKLIIYITQTYLSLSLYGILANWFLISAPKAIWLLICDMAYCFESWIVGHVFNLGQFILCCRLGQIITSGLSIGWA